MRETFFEWIERHRKHWGLTLEEIRMESNITVRRWRGLINGAYPANQEEAEPIATEMFGLYQAEAYTSPEYWVASKFREFLARQEPREDYQLMRLWPKTIDLVYNTTAGMSDTESDEIFEQVLLKDKDDSNW